VDVREARLKEEFAAEYPGIPPEVWLPVAELARKLVERHQAGRKAGRFTRTFDPTHFEFRGGSADRRSHGSRTRSTDLKRRGSESGSSNRRPRLDS
jgi:hypothetical protein